MKFGLQGKDGSTVSCHRPTKLWFPRHVSLQIFDLSFFSVGSYLASHLQSPYFERVTSILANQPRSFLEVNTEAQELNELMLRRREELEELKKRGINPYPHEFDRTAFSQDIINSYKDGTDRRVVAVAGRIMSLRRMVTRYSRAWNTI